MTMDMIGHDHTHGIVDPTIATTERGIWAIKWSFVILAADGRRAVGRRLPLRQCRAARRHHPQYWRCRHGHPAVDRFCRWRAASPLPTFTYGYGRVEDFAGIAIVLIILFSALVAGYEAIDRLIHPRPVVHLGWLAAAGVIGFLGNEAVAVFRIKVGRQINSAALIADGYHARTDGLTSLAVVLGALGVWLGFPVADPIIGLLITVAILGIVWQSGKAVLTRMLDGVEPHIVRDLRHSAEHAQGVVKVDSVRARWLGHRLYAEMGLALDPAFLSPRRARSWRKSRRRRTTTFPRWPL